MEKEIKNPIEEKKDQLLEDYKELEKRLEATVKRTDSKEVMAITWRMQDKLQEMKKSFSYKIKHFGVLSTIIVVLLLITSSIIFIIDLGLITLSSFLTALVVFMTFVRTRLDRADMIARNERKFALSIRFSLPYIDGLFL